MFPERHMPETPHSFNVLYIFDPLLIRTRATCLRQPCAQETGGTISTGERHGCQSRRDAEKRWA